MMADAETDWGLLAERLHQPSWLGTVTLEDRRGHLYLLQPCLDKRKRLTIEIIRDGRVDPDWFGCHPAAADIPSTARDLYPVRKHWRWPKLRRASKRQQAAAKSVGIDADDCYYQIDVWHDPAKCLRHMRKRICGLREIPRVEYEDRMRARSEPEAAA